MRGKYRNRPNAIPPEVLLHIHEQISSFPTKITYYTPIPALYLDAELLVRQMYDLFLVKFLSLQNIVKNEFYLKCFKDKFSLSFGSSCEELNPKIKSSTWNEAAKRVTVAELIVHKRRAKKCYGKLQKLTEL